MSEDDTTSESNGQTQQEKVNWVKRYNDLVAEASEIGLEGYKPATSFRDENAGAKRCEALASSIKARKEGLAAAEKQAAQPGGPVARETQEPDMARTATARKAKTAKRPTKAPAKAKTAAPAVKKDPVAETWGVREGTKKFEAIKFLLSKKNKAVLELDLIKEVYGKKDAEFAAALKGVVIGIGLAIKDNKLKYELVREGKGDEATLTLKTK
jgi:hypothetical protein